MYQYDTYDQRIVEERAQQFRQQVARRLSGEITENEFKPLRLQNGLYMQLHAYMLRVAVPYGLLSAAQIRKLAHIARTYDKGYGHLTTRQNVQYNWPKLEDVPAILDELASVQMHAIQTSGNCIRNTTSDPFAGVARDELEDPRPYAELIRQWSTFHPEFAFLPRKFKIAVTGAPGDDRAAVKVHDIGVRIVENDEGERGFEILVGGGLGRTPHIGKVIREFLPYEHLLSYLEAILRVYNRHGFRHNKYKARIKIIVAKWGVPKFRDAVEAEWAQIKDSAMQVTREEIDRIKAQFVPPIYDDLEDESLARHTLSKDRELARFVQNNLRAHRQPGYVAVVISTKIAGRPPGDLSDTQLDAVADIADQYSHGEAVVTYQQNLVLPHVRQRDIPALYAELKRWDLATANVDRLTDQICCPGLDFCNLANARSIPVALRIAERFDDLDYLDDIGEITVKMSGCVNACGHHHVGNIGILGIDKAGSEAYQLMLGGDAGNDASLADHVGGLYTADELIEAIGAILETYLGVRQHEGERFIDCYRRVGMAPFKEAVVGTAA